MQSYDEKILNEKVDVGLLALCAFVLRQTKAGTDQSRICKSLAQAGMKMDDAHQLVTKILTEMTPETKHQH